MTFSPFNEPRARCLELVDWGITHKNGVPLVITKPVWAAFVAAAGVVTEPSTGTFRYTLPLVLTIQMIDAFPVGESGNFYSFFYEYQRSDCKGGVLRCDTILKQPKFCEGEIIIPPLAPQILFLSLVSGTTYRVWSALLGATFVEIKQIDTGSDPRNVCAVATVALDGEARIYFLQNKTPGNPEVSAMDYDGSSVADYGNPGGTGLNAACIALTYPASKTFPTDPPDFMYWWTQRRGWGNRDTAPANWGTTNFAVNVITAYDGSATDDGLIVHTQGSTPFQRRDYKSGSLIDSQTPPVIPKTLRTDRTRQRTFYLDSGGPNLVEVDSEDITSELSSTLLQGASSVIALIGVDLGADLAYFFEEFGGGTFITTWTLDGVTRNRIIDVEADVTSGVAPLQFSGVLG